MLALDLLSPVFETLAIGFLNHAKADPDLDSLRDDPRWQSNIEEVSQKMPPNERSGVAGNIRSDVAKQQHCAQQQPQTRNLSIDGAQAIPALNP